MVNITINGKIQAVDQTKTLLEIIRTNGIDDIPTLCNNPQLKPFTSCFLCVVEIDGAKGLQPSCATYPREGMIIQTRSKRVVESRKMNLELLLSQHFADCYPPCRIKCPANVDIQGYIALVSRGQYREAQILMRETNALPMVCGRVCARPCEEECRRNFVEQPVDIKNIKRYAADNDLVSEHPYVPPNAPDTNKKAAVIGSGPAGLSAAYFLRQKGHAVTIFEKMPEPGGMLRYGIPEYRLPKKDLEKEIKIILAQGIELKCGKELGKDFSLDSLFDQGYDSVFIGIGCQNGTRMDIPGENLVQQGVDFLRDVNLGLNVKLKGRVFVIGAGNTAIDAARTSLRLGAKEVCIVYRRTEKEMPANWEEIEDAKAEGVKLMTLVSPVEYIAGPDGRLDSVKLQKMELGEPDSSGRRRPMAIKGSEVIEKVDHVIEALGQSVDLRHGLETGKGGTLKVHEKLFTTSLKGVFAGGDAVTGPDIIIAAIGQGRRAAFTMDLYMRGLDLFPEDRLEFRISKSDFKELCNDDYKDRKKEERRHVQKEPVSGRLGSFKEVEKGFSSDDIKAEADRCMECGCQDLYECRLKKYSGEYGADKKHLMVGAWKEDIYKSGNRFIEINTAKCINCGQCLRICADVQKQDVFSFMNRGFDTMVVPCNFLPLGKTNCIVCGACVSGCPTGAITEKLPLGKPGPFQTRKTISHCHLCGDACAINIETRNSEFIKISALAPEDSEFANLCFRGRFGYEKFLDKPAGMSLQKALERAIVSAPKPERTLLAISPVLTIEEIDYALNWAEKQKIAVISPELVADFDKIEILASAGLSPENRSVETYNSLRTLYWFGPYRDEFNAVSFRKFINGKQVFMSAPLRKKYFDHAVLEPENMIKAFLKDPESAAAFNLQAITESMLKDIISQCGQKALYLMLNSYTNYPYLLSRMKNFRKTTGKVRATSYDLVISLNSLLPLNWIKAEQTTIISDSLMDSNDEKIIYIPSIYEREGSVIDQFGYRKVIRKF